MRRATKKAVTGHPVYRSKVDRCRGVAVAGQDTRFWAARMDLAVRSGWTGGAAGVAYAAVGTCTCAGGVWPAHRRMFCACCSDGRRWCGSLQAVASGMLGAGYCG